MEAKYKDLAAQIKAAFAKKGVTLDTGVIHEVLSAESCGSCWNIGCRDGCSDGCMSSCKSGNA